MHDLYLLAQEHVKNKKVEKLVPNLNNKPSTTSSMKTGIEFEESAWLKKYIDLNKKLRTKAKQFKASEADFFQTNEHC